jgi:hypothetical protein
MRSPRVSLPLSAVKQNRSGASAKTLLFTHNSLTNLTEYSLCRTDIKIIESSEFVNDPLNIDNLTLHEICTSCDKYNS